MVRTLIKSLAARYGYDIHRRTPDSVLASDSWHAQRHLLARSPVSTILDVGAHDGETAAIYRSMFPSAAVWTFEPFPEAHARLADRFRADPLVHPWMLAVSDEDGERTLHTNRSAYTNSLLATGVEAAESSGLTTLMETTGGVVVRTVKLDRFCADNAIKAVDILKLDIQGAEMLALRGAEKMLRDGRIGVIYSEVEFVSLYQGQACFPELTAHLEARGYRLFGLYNMMHPGGRRLTWCDAIYARADLLPA